MDDEFTMSISIPTDDDGYVLLQCPNCGKRHDFDYPKCIYCDFDYYAK